MNSTNCNEIKWINKRTNLTSGMQRYKEYFTSLHVKFQS
jgi:hypothetical protein